MIFKKFLLQNMPPYLTNFIDPTPDKDSGMDIKQLEQYINDISN